MGHDIYGHRPTEKEEAVAYLRRSAFSEYSKEIYNALDCLDCSGGVSGIGVDREFSKDDLMRALDYLVGKEELKPEAKFISECLLNIEDDKIVIGFY